ncbi:FAD-dependent oxidoreductase, partial [Rhodococcus sp. C26F]
AQAGCEVTVVADTAPMRPQFGPYLSELFTTAATAAGVKLVYGAATGFAAGTITLDDGSRVTAELVVAAIGDIPNVEWLRESGLLTDGRLVADSRGRVAPGIVAAGDVAHVPVRGAVRRIPLWNSAIEQARIAAAAVLLGDAAPGFDADPYFWTEQFGLHLKAIGHLPVDRGAHRPGRRGSARTDAAALAASGRRGGGGGDQPSHPYPAAAARRGHRGTADRREGGSVGSWA